MAGVLNRQDTLSASGVAFDAQGVGRVLMRVRGLCKAFGGQVVLDGVDLELHEGEVVLLRGENGSGKTTLLNILTGNMEPDSGEIDLFANSHPEHFHFPRHWWQELNPWDHFTPERVAVEGVGRTWQDVRLFGSQTLLDNLAVARPDQPGERPWQIFARPRRCSQSESDNQHTVSALLETLGLGNRGDSSADMISLGQTKRIAFARAAHASTKIIFLDEPLAGLDQAGRDNVLTVLKALASAHRLTLVIVEHVFNIPAILDFATTVWTLSDGHITREATAEALADPHAQQTGTLPALIREMAGADAVITVEPLPRGALLTRVSNPGIPREPLLTIKGLVARRGHRVVVGEDRDGETTGFDLTVYKGDLLFLQAPNGWGKTSLLDVLAGILPAQSGSILLDGQLLDRKSTWERHANGLTIVPARDNIFKSLNIDEYQNICAGTFQKAPVPLSYANRMFSQSCKLSSLSGGERKRLVIENTILRVSKINIWDEPFDSLDGNGVFTICRDLVATFPKASVILMPYSVLNDRISNND